MINFRNVRFGQFMVLFSPLELSGQIQLVLPHFVFSLRPLQLPVSLCLYPQDFLLKRHVSWVPLLSCLLFVFAGRVVVAAAEQLFGQWHIVVLATRAVIVLVRNGLSPVRGLIVHRAVVEAPMNLFKRVVEAEVRTAIVHKHASGWTLGGSPKHFRGFLHLLVLLA